MRWDAFYNPGNVAGHPTVRTGGLMHGGFFPFDHDRPGGVYRGTYIGGGGTSGSRRTTTTRSSPRRGSRATSASSPARCPAATTTRRGAPLLPRATGRARDAAGRRTRTTSDLVYEGAYTYRGMHIVPGWGEACSRSSCPPSSCRRRTGPRAGGSTTRSTSGPSASTGLKEAGYGYRFSPSSNPDGGREYGLDALGMNPTVLLDQENTNYDVGFGECRGHEPEPRLQDRRRDPARLVPRDDVRAGQATANLLKIQKKLGAYGAGGFYDAVAIDGTIARRYLSLDQAMVMGPRQRPREGRPAPGVQHPDVEAALRPVIGIEEFSAGNVGG